MPGAATALRIAAGEVALDADLALPAGALGVVAFAHGSGSSRHSPRNRFVARTLNEARLATLLVDLLTPAEERRDEVDGALRFDIDLLTDRLVAIVDELAAGTAARGLPLGLFGASTGAAAAIRAAAARPALVRAVVSRGGRADLAGEALERVHAPTLLIVGGADREVLAFNRSALRALAAPKELAIVPAATHLFAEPGALEEVARLATRWFLAHLPTRPAGTV